MPYGFITECFQIFTVDKVKNFVANNICSSCWSQSRTWDPCKGLVTNRRFVYQGKEGYYMIKSNWVLERRFNYRLVFQGRPRVVDKIPYTCNRSIVDQWILGSGDLKITRWSFCLIRFSLFVNKSPCQIYLSLHLVFW